MLKKNSAFTLIELVSAISLVGLVFVAGTTSLVSTMKFYGREQTKNRAADDLHLALSWIKKDAMQADLADTSVANQLTLRITDYATGVPVNITYAVVLGVLQRTRGVQTIDITELIAAALPVYSAPFPNYLLVDMSTTFVNDSAQQRLGVMLHGRDRDTDMVGTAALRWVRQ